MLRRPDLPTVDPIEADRRLREDPDRPVLVDVREPNEFVAVRAPGAALYPTSTFLLKMAELPRDRPLLVICHTGNRSASVTGYLLNQGWTDVTNVGGGMDAWERSGLAVRRGTPEPGEGLLPE
jgi:rhodanese-related sulfurtransferase